MNVVIIILLLMSSSFISWHVNTIKKENHQHNILVKNLEEKIAFQKKNSKKPEIQNFESIAFKMAVLNQQVALLTEISNQKN